MCVHRRLYRSTLADPEVGDSPSHGLLLGWHQIVVCSVVWHRHNLSTPTSVKSAPIVLTWSPNSYLEGEEVSNIWLTGKATVQKQDSGCRPTSFLTLIYWVTFHLENRDHSCLSSSAQLTAQQSRCLPSTPLGEEEMDSDTPESQKIQGDEHPTDDQNALEERTGLPPVTPPQPCPNMEWVASPEYWCVTASACRCFGTLGASLWRGVMSWFAVRPTSNCPFSVEGITFPRPLQSIVLNWSTSSYLAPLLPLFPDRLFPLPLYDTTTCFLWLRFSSPVNPSCFIC